MICVMEKGKLYGKMERAIQEIFKTISTVGKEYFCGQTETATWVNINRGKKMEKVFLIM